MEPPNKRRRVNEGPTASTNSAEYAPASFLDIRMKFKSRLEEIFEKYDKDFTGVGDEIDIRTGKIVVNNGHLSKLRNEVDVDGLLSDKVSEKSTDDEDILGLSNGLLRMKALGPQPTDTHSADQESHNVQRKEREAETVRHEDNEEEALEVDLESVRNPYRNIHFDSSKQHQPLDPKWQIPELPEESFHLGAVSREVPEKRAQNSPYHSTSQKASIWEVPADVPPEAVVRRPWTQEEISKLKYYWLNKKLSVRELVPYFPERKLSALNIKCSLIKKAKNSMSEGGVNSPELDYAAPPTAVPEVPETTGVDQHSSNVIERSAGDSTLVIPSRTVPGSPTVPGVSLSKAAVPSLEAGESNHRSIDRYFSPKESLASASHGQEGNRSSPLPKPIEKGGISLSSETFQDREPRLSPEAVLDEDYEVDELSLAPRYPKVSPRKAHERYPQSPIKHLPIQNKNTSSPKKSQEEQRLPTEDPLKPAMPSLPPHTEAHDVLGDPTLMKAALVRISSKQDRNGRRESNEADNSITLNSLEVRIPKLSPKIWHREAELPTHERKERVAVVERNKSQSCEDTDPSHHASQPQSSPSILRDLSLRSKTRDSSQAFRNPHNDRELPMFAQAILASDSDESDRSDGSQLNEPAAEKSADNSIKESGEADPSSIEKFTKPATPTQEPAIERPTIEEAQEEVNMHKKSSSPAVVESAVTITESNSEQQTLELKLPTAKLPKPQSPEPELPEPVEIGISRVLRPSKVSKPVFTPPNHSRKRTRASRLPKSEPKRHVQKKQKAKKFLTPRREVPSTSQPSSLSLFELLGDDSEDELSLSLLTPVASIKAASRTPIRLGGRSPSCGKNGISCKRSICLRCLSSDSDVSI